MDYATVSRLLGRYDEAKGALEQLTRRTPRDARVWLSLGHVSLALQDAPAAVQAFERAAALSPSNADARLGLGWAQLFRGDYQAAAAAWRPLVATTRDPQTLERMALLFGTLGDRAAEQEARAALARGGGAP